MKSLLRTTILALPLLAALTHLIPDNNAYAEDPPLDTGMIPSPLTLMPDGDPQALVVLLSDAPGWQPSDQLEAERLQANGAIVVGIDTPKYIASLSQDKGDCIYTVSDIEALAHQLQRRAGNSNLLPPIIAGRGEGGALALAILAQTPKATIGQTLALDPEAGVPLTKQFCTPAEKKVVGDRMIYGLSPGELPDPATVLFSPAAKADARAHVAALETSHPDIDQRDAGSDPSKSFSDTIDELIAAGNATETPLGLPLTVLDAVPTRDTMAVVYSGDGGWRDLDSQVGTNFQASGIPVVGVDSLRYFWTKKTPEQTTADLATIIHTYEKRWKVKHVLLIGYSFGADILPAAYNGLPEKLKPRVAQISLLALSHQADYEVSVSGWLGTSNGGVSDPLTDVAKIDPSIVQCMFGTEEEDDACKQLVGGPVETIGIKGGHHFDGDYPALAKRILDGLDKRMVK
ncbi:virulance and acid tolerance protein [Agrobacterium albertimagni AOL15]|uniref:Virulance and acid tolerance protein n=1 Tax=Agrobacterium albertimagni AOL15 TaxID=1156935 RepID=K2QPS1_9HYPH|nr:AcvB/VirJ family lysyl-phosphatidylglycerol hydrolase [Agrobacterium albertimagni]EKF56972.1 virulance and acid tolerance protein [Agrobacterium albertimagni AOL15]